jgi:hypothetical protein
LIKSILITDRLMAANSEGEREGRRDKEMGG